MGEGYGEVRQLPVPRPRLVTADDTVAPLLAVQSARDWRVGVVLAVLGGRPADDIAAEWDLESQIVQRWVHDFVAGGSRALTRRTSPEEARQRDRILGAFVEEVRAPLGDLRATAGSIAAGAVADDDVEGRLATLDGELEALSRYLLDAELAASVSLGRVRLQCEELDLALLCDGLPGSPGVRSGSGSVWADPLLLARVLRDLWATAHRPPEPTSVAIDLVQHEAWSEIRVERLGVPIGPGVLRELFDPFGSGTPGARVTMGLYLARALTVAHGGVLGAEGDDGITVLFSRIPHRPAAPPGTPPVRNTDPTRGTP